MFQSPHDDQAADVSEPLADPASADKPSADEPSADAGSSSASASSGTHAGVHAQLRSSLEGLCAQLKELSDRANADVIEDALDEAHNVELVALLETYGSVRRQLDGLGTHIAAEVSRRSTPSPGETELCRQHGFPSATAMIELALGCSRTEAKALVRVGHAIRTEPWLTGGRAPAQCPYVRDALSAGDLAMPAAHQILQFRERLGRRVLLEAAEEGEAILVSHAPELSSAEFRRTIQHLEAHLDPDGLEPKIEQQREARSLVFGTDAGGMTTLRGKFDPETGATIRVALEGFVTQQLRASRGNNLRDDAPGHTGDADPTNRVEFVPTETPGTREAGGVEDRSIPQLQADALAAFCAHIAGCDLSKPLAGPSTTVIVRIPLEALHETSSDGARDPAHVCEIDGIGPIDAATARRMAAAAEIIPVVLGNDSEVLDLGRSKRQFTRAQRLALVERDGGCAFCGLPPGMTEAHHRRWWTTHNGPTDLENGVLLCTSCHHRVHEGWDIIIVPANGAIAETVWFLPPMHIDPGRTPRLGGRKRFDATYRAKHPPMHPSNSRLA